MFLAVYNGLIAKSTEKNCDSRQGDCQRISTVSRTTRTHWLLVHGSKSSRYSLLQIRVVDVLKLMMRMGEDPQTSDDVVNRDMAEIIAEEYGVTVENEQANMVRNIFLGGS